MKVKAHKWLDDYTFWLSFLMAFPVILFASVNLSMLVFAPFVYQLMKYRNPFKFKSSLQWFALFFIFGAVLSVLNIPIEAKGNSFSNAMIVLPNYIYWGIIVIFLIANSDIISVGQIYKGIFWGVACTIVYYFLFQDFLSFLPMFKKLFHNTFAFLMICFSPISVYYLLKKKGRLFAYLLMFMIIILMIIEGERAGTVLVAFGGLAVIFTQNINIKQMLKSGLILFSLTLSLNLTFVENMIYSSSDRVHELIYERDAIQGQDRSLLIRFAMIDKGFSIFNLHPFTGIGLNNFGNYDANIEGDFEGSNFIIHKSSLNRTSSHNSYINLLAEGGLFLFAPFILMLGSLIFF